MECHEPFGPAGDEKRGRAAARALPASQQPTRQHDGTRVRRPCSPIPLLAHRRAGRIGRSKAPRIGAPSRGKWSFGWPKKATARERHGRGCNSHRGVGVSGPGLPTTKPRAYSVRPESGAAARGASCRRETGCRAFWPDAAWLCPNPTALARGFKIRGLGRSAAAAAPGGEGGASLFWGGGQRQKHLSTRSQRAIKERSTGGQCMADSPSRLEQSRAGRGARGDPSGASEALTLKPCPGLPASAPRARAADLAQL